MQNFLFALFASASLLHAQTNVVLDGTSGTNSTSTSYSTDGGLNLSLGFFADYLVVGGGGSGGTAGSVSGTGGGGAGGLLQGNTQLSSSNYSVTVGAGGVAPNTAGSSSVQGVNGTNSVFGNLTAVGGGGGGRFNVVGNSGGSGGGGGGRNDTAGGSGTTSNSIVQGNAGGTARGGNDTGRSGGGGGGGAGSVGGNGAPTSSTAGNGGAGLTNSITGSAVVYAGGGGGGAFDSNSGAGKTAGTGGTGGGGAGSTSGNASNGTNGLGGGGGGAGDSGRGGNGGSGVVIVRYQGASLGNIGGTVTSGTGSAAGHTIHTFSSTGNSSLDLSGVDMSTRLGTTLSGVLSGTGGMTYNGPGTLRLIANNTFTGETRIANGTLALESSHALRYSTLNMASSDSGALSFQPSLPGNYTYLLGGLTGSRDIAMGGHSLRIGENNGNTTYSGNISGSGGLTKVGTGTLTLSGNNTYSDQTHVTTGTLATTGDNRLGTSKILNISTTATLRLGGNETFQQINGYGNIIVGNNAFLTYHPTAPANHLGFIANSISGEGGFIKDGASSVNLSRSFAYTYTGDTIVNAGTLWTQMENQLPTGNTVIVNSGATLGLIGNQTLGVVTGSGTVYIGDYNLTIGATSGTFSGSLVGSAKLIKNGAGTLTLSGNSSGSFTGDADITGGTLVLNSANALSTDAVITMSADTTLTVNQRTFVGALDQGGGAVNGPGELVATLTSTSSGSLNAVIADGVDFSAGILKRTGSTTTVGAANTFTGAVKVQDGTLQLTGSGSFSSASSLVTSTGATMDLNNKSQTFSKVSGLGGTVALGNGTLTVNQASDTEYGGAITGSGGFVKSGAGNFTLSGASTYLGATTVSAGQLIVDGSLSSATTVESGASLSGSGSVGAISGSGSINPGNSPGILTAPSVDASGGLSFNFEFSNINPVFSNATASVNDLLRLTSGTPFTASLTSANSVNIYFNVGSFGAEQTYKGGFFTDTQSNFLGAIAGATFNYYVAAEGGAVVYNGVNYTLLDESLDIVLTTTAQNGADFAGGTVNGQIAQFQVVPEPSTYALLALAAAGLGAHVLRRRRR